MVHHILPVMWTTATITSATRHTINVFASLT